MEKMRYPNRASLSPASRDAEVGSVTLASLFLTVVLVGAMIACLSIGVLWRAKMNLSLRLDRCVEKTALTLESIQSKIEASNTRMQVTRAAAIAASIPTAGASVRAAKPVLIAEMLFQEALRAKWKAEQITWIARRGCDRKGDAFLPLPSLEWWRPPEDPIGPMPLQWKGSKETGMRIRLWKSNRASAARVAMVRRKWKAEWEAPWKLGSK